jgi:hypothetical protein
VLAQFQIARSLGQAKKEFTKGKKRRDSEVDSAGKDNKK